MKRTKFDSSVLPDFSQIFVFTPGVRPAIGLTPNLHPFFSHPFSPEDSRGCHLSKLVSSIIFSHAFVCMPGRSSSTSGRWPHWHPQVGETQRKITASEWEWGFLTGHGAAPITWAVLSALFLGTSVDWVCLCGSRLSLPLSFFYYFRNTSSAFVMYGILEGWPSTILQQGTFYLV